MRLSRSRAPAEERYLRAVVPGPSLEGNPLGSPAQRELHVYLPPGYHQDPTRRYPVLYFLHGWGAADLGELAARTRGALAGVRLLVNCAEDDEFGLAGPCRRFAKRLGGLGLDCSRSRLGNDRPELARLMSPRPVQALCNPQFVIIWI